MKTSLAPLALMFALLVPAPSAQAQAANPSGHWEGVISAPMGELRFEMDLAKNEKGEWMGTFSQPAQGVRGLPLNGVSVSDQTVRMVLGAGGSANTFTGSLMADGKSMMGDVMAPLGSAQFSMARTGDARIEAPPRNAAVGKELEGRWDGTLDVAGRQIRLVLKVANHADGTATAVIATPDQSPLEFPTAITQKATSVSVDIKITSAAYTGTLNAAGTEMVGTFTQGPVSAPLTFKRAE